MSWYSWQLQLSKSCRPLPLARTYAARPDSPFWRLRIALATKRRALADQPRYSGEVFGRFRPALQHLFACSATIISNCGKWGRRRGGRVVNLPAARKQRCFFGQNVACESKRKSPNRVYAFRTCTPKRTCDFWQENKREGNTSRMFQVSRHDDPTA